MRNNFSKKIFSTISIIAILINFTSCSYIDNTINQAVDIVDNSSNIKNQINDNYNPITAVEEEITSYDDLKTTTVDALSIKNDNYKSIKLNHCYNALATDNQKLLYSEMVKSVYTVTNEKNDNNKYLLRTIELDGITLNQEDILIVLEAFTNDNPEVFWLDNFLTYFSDGYTMTVQFYSHLNSSDIESYSNKLEIEINSILSHIPQNLNEYERELYIHDTLLTLCTYDYDALEDNGVWTSYTIYGALVNGLAVCEGYSKAMQLLLKYSGIESTLANGKYEDTWHQWNVVKIDDEWYHLDATWNDSENQIFYNYFNVTTSQISKDRTVSKNYTSLTAVDINGSDSKDAILFNIDLPKCTSDKANYYVNNAILFHNFDDSNTKQIENELINAVNNNKNAIYIKIGNNLDYNYTTDALFFNEPYKFFECANNANNELGSINIDLDSISIIQRNEFRIIEVYFQYY